MDSFSACGGLRRSVPCSSLYHVYSSSGPNFTCATDSIRFQGAKLQAIYQVVFLKSAYRVSPLTYSFPKEHFGRLLQLVIDEEPSRIRQTQSSVGSFLKQIKSERIPADKNEKHLLHDLDRGIHEEADSASSPKSTANICSREMQRRQKIGLANKGRTPWNKGRKHTEETRERIKKRTIEALRDPKVRKKMSGCSRAHSDQSKARISFALRRIWHERLKRRRLQETCYLAWKESIAVAAKKGGPDELELDWDSYERMKADVMLQYAQRKADKARAKEIAKLRAERATKARAKKVAKLAQQRKEKEQKARAREIKKKVQKKSEDEKKELAVAKGLKLKKRLTKFHHRKKQLESLVDIQIDMAVEPQLVSEKWDLEFIKMEKTRRRVSLADQIQVAKNKKAGFSAKEVLATASCSSSLEEKA